VLAVAEDLLDGSAMPVPVLRRGGLVRRRHVQVRQDEAVAVDRVSAGELGDREGTLARVQGAAPPEPRVGGDLLRCQLYSADQQECSPAGSCMDAGLRVSVLCSGDPPPIASGLWWTVRLQGGCVGCGLGNLKRSMSRTLAARSEG